MGKRYLRTNGFKPNFVPGICPYKSLYVWMHLRLEDVTVEKGLGWLYRLPNPIFPFIWYRVGLPGVHPALLIERRTEGLGQQR